MKVRNIRKLKTPQDLGGGMLLVAVGEIDTGQEVVPVKLGSLNGGAYTILL